MNPRQKTILIVGGEKQTQLCLRYVLDQYRHLTCPLDILPAEIADLAADLILICTYAKRGGEVIRLIDLARQMNPVVPVVVFSGAPEDSAEKLEQRNVQMVLKPDIIALRTAVAMHLS